MARDESAATLPPVPSPPSPKALQFLRWTSDPIGYPEACQRQFGSVFALRTFLFDRIVFATDPDDVKTVLTETETFRGGDMPRKLAEPVVGATSVMTTAGETHMRQRKLLLPPMHKDLVARWTERIEAITAPHLANLPLGTPTAMRPVMQQITLEIICRVVFGAESKEQSDDLAGALTNMLEARFAPLLVFPGVLKRNGPLSPARPYLRRRARVHALIGELIAERRRAGDLEEREDVLSMLVAARDEEGRGFSDVELRDQLMTLLLAGHDTTATALAWALERLSRNPRVQKRLVEEVRGDGGEYLTAVVNETLRVRSPAFGVPRMTARETELGGYRLPPETSVLAMIVLTQRRPDIWPEPLEFQPERFLDGKPTPYSFTPFGGGVRRCIGASLALLEMRLVLEAFARRFELHPAPGRPEAARMFGVTLIPSRGGSVVVTQR